jgi:hypothetical protein
MNRHLRQRNAFSLDTIPSAHPAKFIDPTTPLRYPKPMKVSAQYADEHFAHILNAASGGEDVEIAVPTGQPTA